MATLFTHAIQTNMYRENDESTEQIGQAPADVAMELIQNEMFNRPSDTWSTIDRHIRLWREFGPVASRNLNQHDPADLFHSATGLEIEDALALGMAIFGLLPPWRLGDEIGISRYFSTHPSVEVVDLFVNLVSASFDDFAEETSKSSSFWDFEYFGRNPVMRQGEVLLVLDEQMLLSRVMFGIYEDVVRYVRNTRYRKGFEEWSKLYGKMLELLVQDQVMSMSLNVLGGSTGRAVLLEDDLSRQIFPKQCDALLDFGSHVVAIEIAKRRLDRKSRIQGSVPDFKRDTERVVLEEVEQLDVVASVILSGAADHLLSDFPHDQRRVLPILVLGERYPRNPITHREVGVRMEKLGLLDDRRIEPLAIIDIEELEMLEALAEDGHSLVDVLLSWKSSSLSTSSLHLYVASSYANRSRSPLRPSRMNKVVHATMRRIIERIGLSVEEWDAATRSRY